MSVLIKGMEMPKNCLLCPLSVLNGERLYCEVTKDEVLRAKKPSDCPLIHVPPHGDLIDRDALKTDCDLIHSMMMFGGQIVYTQSAIENASAIIEAEAV